jgi:hypothetical protein
MGGPLLWGSSTVSYSPNMDPSGSSSGSDDKTLLEGETCKLTQRQDRLLQVLEGGEHPSETKILKSSAVSTGHKVGCSLSMKIVRFKAAL